VSFALKGALFSQIAPLETRAGFGSPLRFSTAALPCGCQHINVGPAKLPVLKQPVGYPLDGTPMLTHEQKGRAHGGNNSIAARAGETLARAGKVDCPRAAP
jgi:hypothetical protein